MVLVDPILALPLIFRSRMYLTIAAFISRFASTVIFSLLNDTDNTEPQWNNEQFPTTVALNTLIVAAEIEINSYLAAYDLSLFQDEVPFILIELASNITLYKCHMYRNFENIPAEVIASYNKAKSILEGIANGSFVLYNSQVKPSARLITSFTAVNFMTL